MQVLRLASLAQNDIRIFYAQDDSIVFGGWIHQGMETGERAALRIAVKSKYARSSDFT
jgi:hypothetical protein